MLQGRRTPQERRLSHNHQERFRTNADPYEHNRMPKNVSEHPETSDNISE